MNSRQPNKLNFRDRVIEVVKTIPKGKVASYGQIAALVGSPRAARQVGWTLASSPLDGTVPWWRVVNKQGYLSIRGNDIEAKLTQKSLLEQEGIKVNDLLSIDMKLYTWKPDSQGWLRKN